MNTEINPEGLHGLCEWLKEVKGVTIIDIMELVSYIPEYESYCAKHIEQWTFGNVKCDLCGHIWVAVYCIYSEKLECPNCHNMTNYD